MTFPNEQKNCQQAEKELMVKSAFFSLLSFFGLMSICAAHRAIMAGRHSDLMDSSTSCHRVLHDPDYYVMKANCIRAVNKKLSDPCVVQSDETFDTIINLLTSTVCFLRFNLVVFTTKGWVSTGPYRHICSAF